ncbi:RsfA family transcriptional regulator [Halobacillus sp. ACCC02827]|uniref:RsfA family transcriptional regulator n=1 Tax=unclassified Halobacillus TaxID=2636472 RepID=UPI0002A51DD7|nr:MULTISPECIES: RsfA family transcriptional regulator [unclassified Halobacillus]ELK44814.1 prespore-specific transcription regulator RsfA [Halobacillus sp. BAB-2008]WJE14490.1 RsfA family transcriptional regulator [Halobacillus sp. ACCC02827]
MPKVRQDAWSHEDDLLLAETVLRHIREGSTQLRAFDEVGDLLNRTSAACGFRWNAEVRQKYEQAVELAKKQRKEKKRNEAKQQVEYPQPSRSVPEEKEVAEHHAYTYTEPLEQAIPGPRKDDLNLTDVIRFLDTLQKETSASGPVQQQLNQLEAQNEELMERNNQLSRQLESMSEDYQALIQIMDRARKMVLFDEQDATFKPQFRMEKNGNLENVAR